MQVLHVIFEGLTMVYNTAMSTPVEQIKERLDLVQFIGGYVKLQKAGANFKACCPFHGEKTPSFNVSPVRNIWHCFGCGRGGDVFQFLMELEHIEFPEALRALAERAGVELKREDPALRSHRNKLLELLEEATVFFERELKEEKAVHEYLKNRGLSGLTASVFRLGFASHDWRDLAAHLAAKGYSYKEMEEVGLVIHKDDAKSENAEAYFDRFRSRIMFPFFNNQGKVIGFSGRIFVNSKTEADKAAKYMNSPETIFFNKSAFLYNFDKARESMRKEESVVLVEGQMDVLLSFQSGVQNVVAVSGTAFTAGHAELIKRFAERLILAFDMDDAGIAAARKAVVVAGKAELSTSIIELPKDTDPADIAAKDKEEWKTAVTSARESIAFFIDRAIERHGRDTAEGKRAIGKEIFPLVAEISSEIEKAHWVGIIARKLSIPEDSCRKELNAHEQKQSQEDQKSQQYSYESEAPTEAKKVKVTRKVLLEKRLAGLLLYDPALIKSAKNLPKSDECDSELAKALFSMLENEKISCDSRDNVVKKMNAALQSSANEAVFEVEQFIDLVKHIDDEINSCILGWHNEHRTQRLKELEVALSMSKDEKERNTILENIRLTSTQILSNDIYDKKEKSHSKKEEGSNKEESTQKEESSSKEKENYSKEEKNYS